MKLSELLIGPIQEWKWEVLSFELPPGVKERIKAIPRQQVNRGEDVIMWKCSKDGEFNTKSAYALSMGMARGGGIIRDCEGRWVKGFARSIGFTTSILAEFWSLRDGLLLADQIGVQKLVIELDAKEWKWEVLSFELPLGVKERIKAIPRQQVNRGEDVIMWKCSKDGEFNTKSAYALSMDLL
nr:putative ribonuclease h protein [Quercus suber]